MSTTDLYILNGQSTTHLAEFRNGHGSAPICWDYLGKKYIDEKPIYSLSENYLKKVWALDQLGKLTDQERIVMRLTFDRCYIPLDYLNETADACSAFGHECEDDARVNHWPAIGVALKDAANMKFNRHARGIVMSCTSVCDPWIQPSSEYLSNAWPINEQSN